ncbi:centrosomal protein of 76 kDa isoform X1 [Hippoglossus hippoglossus]|uniref:centrosomal protein of 76 kDa isoform X1 n=1 Tax=Hippoglossus hippoglossus TaxID=8267 RepID=UPI00148CB137|nr:centrosomal protein of 76 kDa isoform X1 [Hippoglossus hippoglossus]XP_035019393.1 centrosomal protein of 76 kDa isoform X1 [Hippoglossus stenolepis]
MSLPPEKVSELKQIIHNHLLKSGIRGKIREVLAENVRDDQGRSHQSLSEADFLSALQNRGIIDDVMKDLHFNQEALMDAKKGSPPKRAPDFVDKEITQLKKSNIDPSRRYLYLQVLGGKAFLEHLQEPEPLPGQVCSTFTLYVHFRNQRFHSKPVPCACEPNLEEGLLFEIHRDGIGESNKMADATALLSVSDPVHLVLIKTDTSSETTLVSSYFLDWRIVLGAPSRKTCFAVELMGVGSESKVPAGVLTVSLELYPPLTETLSTDIISTQQSLERKRTAEKERLFLVYAKQWWREFLEIRPSHQSKMVKIFAQDENGVNQPVCSYVRVLRVGRLLESPRQAARFVSLLAHEKAPVVGGGGQEQWCTLMAFLCRGKGDCEDHATLLCSLLLGFGLDAYVCVGTKAKGVPHTWVLTRGTDGSITFWESLTAHRYLHQAIDPEAPPLAPQPKPSSPYRTVGCVFNHQNFLANCQPSDAVELCVFDFQNQSCWKAMSEDALKSVCDPGSVTSLPLQPSLCASSLDPASSSNQLEFEMRYLVSEHRKDLELATVWDDHLSYLLSSALSAYELERCTGVSCGNEEFQDAVRRAVPDGHTFKGFPIHFLHRSARRAFATCLRSPFCQEIVSCRGDHVRLAVRVRVFVYPENVCAVWLMFACKYRSVL